jgi:mono/diheme cytochrome c family protein
MSLILALIIMLTSFGIYQLQTRDPYIKGVLTLKGDPVQGEAIFQQNCAVCHQSLGPSQVGPNLHGVWQRKSEISLIYQVTSGKTPPMPQFQPSTQAMADLLRYLQQI